jgi:tight adherence protein C
MLFAILAFCAIFILIVSGGLLIFYRETVQQRISDAINPSARQRTMKTRIEDTRVMLGGVVGRVEKFVPRSESEVSIVQKRLIMAGFREEVAVKYFYASKVIGPLSLCLIVLLSGLAKDNPFFIYVVCLGVGYLVPDFWLGRMIKKRQAQIRKGLPDVLDMLIICVEAGLSLDQATARTAEELRHAQPELSDELGIVALEQRAGSVRADAWKHLSERTGVDTVRNLVTTLIQSEQFGTSIGKTLRVHSDTLRTKRVQEIEEKAAKLPIKLIFPLVFFIFPPLFLVTLGPAAIIMAESFKTLFNH